MGNQNRWLVSMRGGLAWFEPTLDIHEADVFRRYMVGTIAATGSLVV
jgi:hypothetical protein